MHGWCKRDAWPPRQLVLLVSFVAGPGDCLRRVVVEGEGEAATGHSLLTLLEPAGWTMDADCALMAPGESAEAASSHDIGNSRRQHGPKRTQC